MKAIACANYGALNALRLTTLPDPFERDLSPWLLRRLRLASELATRLRGDAQQILQPAQR